MAALLAVSMSVAAGLPTVKYKLSGGWMFDTDEGERFCRTTGAGGVECMDQAGNQYVCTYQDPPQFFTDCKKR